MKKTYWVYIDEKADSFLEVVDTDDKEKVEYTYITPFNSGTHTTPRIVIEQKCRPATAVEIAKLRCDGVI